MSTTEKDPVDRGSISDGYHTFDELYEHRHALFLALARRLRTNDAPAGMTWMSREHADGSALPGWFICGIGMRPGLQMSYHLPLRLWEEARLSGLLVMDRAPEWDGHTAADVVERLGKLL